VLGSALVLQHAEDLLVRVAVVDDQRDSAFLGDADVRPERGLLRRPAVGAGAEPVQAGLPHRAHPRQGGEPVDLDQRVVVGRTGAGLVRVDGDGGQHVRVPGGELRRPPRGADVDPDLHQPRDAHGRGGGDLGVHRGLVGQPVAVEGDVEVSVAVDRRRRERLGGRRRLPPPVGAGRGRPTHWAFSSSRASSSATIDSSSFVNTGVGGASGVPACSGREAHTACAES
jgi:hypothetical protein